jgi:putative hydrolase of the HAD superfamily
MTLVDVPATKARSRAIWCDFGGVLTPPVAVTVAAFCARVGAPAPALMAAMAAVARRFGTDDLMEPLDTPLISEAEWSSLMEAEVRVRFGLSIDLSNFAEAWFAHREPNAELVAHLKALRARGVFVGMLSNMVPSWDAYWRVMVPPEDMFDDVVMSFQIGTRKPQRAIYELAAQRAGLPPESCVLIDDLEQNCVGAHAAGWHAIHYTDNTGTIEQLERWL